MKILVVITLAITLAILMNWNLTQDEARLDVLGPRTQVNCNNEANNSTIPNPEQPQDSEILSYKGDWQASVAPVQEERSTALPREKVSDSPHRVARAQSSAPVQKTFGYGLNSNPNGFQSSSSRSVGTPLATLPESLMVWEVDDGLPLPVVLTENDSETAAPLLNAKESIIQDFEKGIGVASASDSEVEVHPETWLKEKAKADARYKSLYGDAAYNQRAMEALQTSLTK
jgi:hypothetical protein